LAERSVGHGKKTPSPSTHPIILGFELKVIDEKLGESHLLGNPLLSFIDRGCRGYMLCLLYNLSDKTGRLSGSAAREDPVYV
jgi:hypothetical protein